LPPLEPISCRKFNQNPEIWHPSLIYVSCFGTIKLPKVQIGTLTLPQVTGFLLTGESVSNSFGLKRNGLAITQQRDKPNKLAEGSNSGGGKER